MRLVVLLLVLHAQYCACLQSITCSSSSSGKALSRRAVFEQSVRGASAAVLLSASPASALIKGNAPPTAEERQRRKLAQGQPEIFGLQKHAFTAVIKCSVRC
jgi:hypothetical protein